jgi:phosphoglycerate dehydrogenase-like enzyme
MRILACKRDPERRAEQKYRPEGVGDPDGKIPKEFFGIDRLHEMMSRCDAVIVTLPRTPATIGLVGADAIRALPPHAVLINTGRGAVVNETAVADALREKKIAAAALDVFAKEPLPADSPLWDVPNLLITPHIGSWTIDQAQWAGRVLIDNLRRCLAGEPLVNQVDLNEGY